MLDLWAPCLMHLNLIDRTTGARGAVGATVKKSSSVIGNKQLCRISAKVNYCTLLSLNSLRKSNHSHLD